MAAPIQNAISVFLRILCIPTLISSASTEPVTFRHRMSWSERAAAAAAGSRSRMGERVPCAVSALEAKAAAGARPLIYSIHAQAAKCDWSSLFGSCEVIKRASTH
jgi:hypothetical protein